MFTKFVLSRRRVVLVVACLLVWWAGVALYMQSQEPLGNQLTDSTWCGIPFPFPLSKMAFEEDGRFFSHITMPDGICATVIDNTGSWSVAKEGSDTWIRIFGREDILVNFHTQNFMRLEGDFLGSGNEINLNLYRCNDTFYLR